MQETQECLLCLRVPLEKIKEKTESLLPVGHDPAVADSIAERAAKLISTAYGKDRTALCGKSPTGIMAGAIYLSGRMENDIDISQKIITKELKITEPTIRKRARQLNKLIGLECYRKRDQYVCPLCKESFSTLISLRIHLQGNRIVNTFEMRSWMFNDDGVLVDRDMLNRLKHAWEGHPGRREFYLCPFCERKFTFLGNLKSHLHKGWWKYSSKLRVRMFNEEGTLVDENMLEALKKGNGDCDMNLQRQKKPPPERYIITAQRRQGLRVRGRYRRYIITG